METVTQPVGSPAVNLISLALAKAQSKFILPEKNKTVEVVTKTGQKYKFDYADYSAIVESVRGPLAENEIAFTHFLIREHGGLVLKTQLIHSSGQILETLWPLRPSSDPKDIGGDMTYGKRYSLSALTGCVADDDVDVAPGSTDSFGPKKSKPPVDPKPPGPVVKPKETSQAPASAASNPPPAATGLTDKQRALLFARAAEREWTHDQIKGYLEFKFQITSTSQLTPAQFSALLETIETKSFGQACLTGVGGRALDGVTNPPTEIDGAFS